MTDAPVVVVGAGWAGLSAAATLARSGVACTLLESARQPGGRARGVTLPVGAVDNGQHLLIGAYRETLALLADLGADERRLFRRHRLELRSVDLHDGLVRLRAPRLPAPLHLAVALATAIGLSAVERQAALAFGVGLLRRRFVLPDVPLGPLLAARGQPQSLVRALWEPLCLATLNTPIATASAAIFARVLQRAFTGRRRYCDLLMPRTDLSGLLPAFALPAIERSGGTLRTGCRVTGLESRDDRVTGIRLADGGTLPARHVILATPPRATARLVAGVPALAGLGARLARFGSQPIDTVYLQYPPSVRLPGPMQGVLGGHTQWLLDRRDSGQPGLIAAVISAEGPHRALSSDALADAVAAELARLFPDWPAAGTVSVTRERHATFASEAGIEALRPGNASDLAGCWLAGDWTATGLPATIEGAVQSGVQSARLILAARAAEARTHQEHGIRQ